MICFNKITEIYSIIDEFCENFEQQTSHFLIGNKPKRTPVMNTSEVITIILLFHLSGFQTFKHFYLFYVQKHMQSEFPKTVSYNRFVELQQSCIMPLTIFLKKLLFRKHAQAFHLWIPRLYEFVTTSVFAAIKYSKDLLQPANLQWAGFMASNCILSSMTKGRF